MSIPQLNGTDRLRATTAAAAMRSNAAYAGQSATAPVRQPDEVSLSASARAVAAARKSVASAPDVREERVQAIKAAISKGTYSVDVQQLARAMTHTSTN